MIRAPGSTAAQAATAGPCSRPWPSPITPLAVAPIGGAGGAELHGPPPGRDRLLGVVARAGGDEHAQQVRAGAVERGEGLPDGDLGRALQVRARRHPVAEPPSVRHACLPRSPPIVAAVGADGHHPPALGPTATRRHRTPRAGAPHDAGSGAPHTRCERPPPAPKRRSGGVRLGAQARSSAGWVARHSRCMPASVERSRTSARLPGSTRSRAITRPSAVVTQKHT